MKDNVRGLKRASKADLAGSFRAGSIVGGRYYIERLLGEGAKKRVHLARDDRLGRQVALAVLKADLLDAESVGRILEEARTMARLGDHPRIVSVYDVSEEADQPYIVSQYMAGGTVAALQKQADAHRLPLDQVLTIADQVCQALEHAHRHGTVHRDLKPSNVWLTHDGFAKLGDFGLAIAAHGSVAAEQRTLLIGTVAYMSPEQILGRPVDARADLYALGALLYELVTGRPPFDGDNALAIISQHLDRDAQAPSSYDPDLPQALEALILQLLAKTPEARPQSAAAVREALDAIAAAREPDAAAQRTTAAAGGVFVGRDEEMRELRRALEDALCGRGRVLLLAGEPGIGKTRMTDELAGIARGLGAQVLVGRCYEGEGAPAYWPWVQMIRSYVRDHEPKLLKLEMGEGASDIGQVVPELHERVRDLPRSASQESEQARFRLFDSITRFLKTAAQGQPLVLVLDDLHWADKPSLFLLQFLTREVAGARLLVIGTYRDVDVQGGHKLEDVLPSLRRERVFRRIHIRGLSEDAVRSMLTALRGAAVPEGFAKAIFGETEGNPFFIEEILRHLVEEGVIFHEGGRWTSRLDPKDISIPESVREVVSRRLSRLSDPSKRLLGIASVSGREFELRVLQVVAGIEREPLLEILEEVAAAGVIQEVPDTIGRYGFSHALIRETLYDGLRSVQRAQLHRQIGVAMEELYAADPEPRLGELAHHFIEALPGSSIEKAIIYATRAGERAIKLFAYEEAVGHYERALRALLSKDQGEEERRCELLLALGDAERKAGNTSAAKQTLARAAELARELGAAEQLAKSALALGSVGFGAGWFGDLTVDELRLGLLEEARQALGEKDSSLRARVLNRLAIELYWSPQRDRCSKLADEAVAVARRLGDPAELAAALMGKYVVSWGPDSGSAPAALINEALQLSQQAGDRETVLEIRGKRLVELLSHWNRPAIDDAIDEYERLAQELRQAHHLWYAQVLRSMQAMLDGRLADAERISNEALALGTRAQDQNAFLFFGAQSTTLRTLQGRAAELVAGLKGFVARHPVVAVWRSSLAITLLEAGNEREARIEFERFAKDDFTGVPRDLFWIDSICLLVLVASLLDDERRAAKLYQLLSPYQGRYVGLASIASFGPVAFYLGAAAVAVRRWDQAARHFEDALEQSAAMRDRPWQSMIQASYAFVLLIRRRSGDEKRSREILRESCDSARQIGIQHLERPAFRNWLSKVAAAEQLGEVFERELALASAQSTTAEPVSAAVLSSAREPARAAGVQSRRRGLFQRIETRVRMRGIKLLAWLIGDASDEKLERWFGKVRRQWILFRLTALSFQPDKAFGFQGDVVHELTYSGTGSQARDADSWTIAVKGRKAKARRGGSDNPTVRVRIGLANHVRLVAGILNPVAALLDGLTDVEGDLLAASRLVEMFGGVSPRTRGSSDGVKAAPLVVPENTQPAEKRPWVAHNQYEYARALLLRGDADDRERGFTLLNRTLELAQELGMKHLVEKLLALKLEAQGISSGDVRTSIDEVVDTIGANQPDLRAQAAPDGTVTLMFSDMEGFTEMTDRLGDSAAHKVMHAHNAMVRQAVEAHDGFELELQGDGFLVAFAKASSAIRSAITLQQRLAAYSAEHPAQPIRVRIGLHTGEPIREGDRFFGKTVIQAARIAAQARGGQILVSSIVKELTQSSSEFRFDGERELKLKGLSGSYRVYDVVWEGRVGADENPAPSAAPSPRTATVETETRRGDAFIREGDYWTLVYEGRRCQLRDGKGLRYIAKLLARCGEGIHVTELVTGGGAEEGPADEAGVRSGLGAAGDVLDATARAQYRERIGSLQCELEEARRFNDPGRAARLEEEIEFLNRELSAAFGLGGRARKSADINERARKAVASRVRDSISRIRAHDPALSLHLANNIQLGTFCCYRPEKPPSWTLST